MIVKVQISIASNTGRKVLIYNEDRSICYEDNNPEQLAHIDAIFDSMEFNGKAYFNAHINGTLIVLDKLAKWQDW